MAEAAARPANARHTAGMSASRVSGLLLHPTSLPSAYGLGDLGPEALRFLDFLEAAGQRV